MLRFVNNLRSRSRQQERKVGPLNPLEILKAALVANSAAAVYRW